MILWRFFDDHLMSRYRWSYKLYFAGVSRSTGTVTKHDGATGKCRRSGRIEAAIDDDPIRFCILRAALLAQWRDRGNHRSPRLSACYYALRGKLVSVRIRPCLAIFQDALFFFNYSIFLKWAYLSHFESLRTVKRLFECFRQTGKVLRDLHGFFGVIRADFETFLCRDTLKLNTLNSSWILNCLEILGHPRWISFSCHWNEADDIWSVAGELQCCWRPGSHGLWRTRELENQRAQSWWSAQSHLQRHLPLGSRFQAQY